MADVSAAVQGVQDAAEIVGCRLVNEVFEDVVLALSYLDPNTRGPVIGRDAMRAYLTKLFGRWTLTWERDEVFPLAGTDGVAIRWAGKLAPAGDSRSVDIAGLDLVILEGELVRRNEVYFDRSPLAALMTGVTA